MGSPKALLRVPRRDFPGSPGGPVGARVARPVIVVLGAARARSAPRARAAAPRSCVNPDYARGQTSSMQCGLRAVPAGADGVLFTLVDHPAVAPATIDAAARSGGARPPLAARAALPGPPRPSHLVLARADPGVSGPARRAARPATWCSRMPRETEFLDLDDPGIVADIDDPEDYRGLAGAGP